VSDESAVIDTVGQAAGALGRVSVLCNVAGIGAFSHTVDMSLDSLAEDSGREPDGNIPHGQGRTTPNARGQGRSIVNVGIERRPDGLAVVGGLLRVEGWVSCCSPRPWPSSTPTGACAPNAVAPGGVDTPLVANFAVPEGGDASSCTAS